MSNRRMCVSVGSVSTVLALNNTMQVGMYVCICVCMCVRECVCVCERERDREKREREGDLSSVELEER